MAGRYNKSDDEVTPKDVLKALKIAISDYKYLSKCEDWMNCQNICLDMIEHLGMLSMLTRSKLLESIDREDSNNDGEYFSEDFIFEE